MVRYLLIALPMLTLAFFPGPAGAAASCEVPADDDAIPLLDDTYMRIMDNGRIKYLQIWEDTNDAPGLQTTDTVCADGWPVARDTLKLSMPITSLTPRI